MTLLPTPNGRFLSTIVISTCITLLSPLAALSQGDAVFDPASFDAGLEEVATGLENPTAIVQPPEDTSRLFVLEQVGRVRIVEDTTLVETPYLDLTGRVGSEGSEQGLLGLAFAPDFAASGLFYLNYTDLDGNTVVARYTASDDPAMADPDSEEIILQQEQPAANHNGGVIAFGPDGFLYIGLGDGGNQGDPNGNGQDLGTWLGKVLRIEVDPANAAYGEMYAVPDDNPFVGETDAQPEIWAYGFRNPWRFSFDRETGDLWIGDVGQGDIEEVDLLAAGESGVNFGWNTMEGSTCYAEDPCDEDGLTLPVVEYTHDEGGCSVTGGYVYRGEAMPDLDGVYLYADYCSGKLWGAGQDSDGEWMSSEPVETGLSISSFGEDGNGEIYLSDLASGTIYQVAAPL